MCGFLHSMAFFFIAPHYSHIAAMKPLIYRIKDQQVRNAECAVLTMAQADGSRIAENAIRIERSANLDRIRDEAFENGLQILHVLVVKLSPRMTHAYLPVVNCEAFRKDVSHNSSI